MSIVVIIIIKMTREGEGCRTDVYSLNGNDGVGDDNGVDLMKMTREGEGSRTDLA